MSDLVPDSLWERVAPLLPHPPRRRRFPGRKPIDDRASSWPVMTAQQEEQWSGIAGVGIAP